MKVAIFQQPPNDQLRASSTILQIDFAFMYLQKSLKNIYKMVWHLDFAILLTWQKEGKD